MKCFYNNCAQSCVDCSQSPIFPCDRRCRCGSLITASETEESTFCYLVSRDQDDGPVELNDRHLRSHGKIGDCEQSKSSVLCVNSVCVNLQPIDTNLLDRLVLIIDTNR